MADDPSDYSSRLDAFTLYHLVQQDDHVKSGIDIAPALPALGHALAGSLATATAKAVIYPLDLVITRLQVQRQFRGEGEAASAGKDGDAEYTSLLDAARKIYANEGGLKPFYVGLSSEIGKGIADSFLFFLIYTYLRQRQLHKDNVKNLTVFKELGVGVVAGAISKFFTTPVQNVVTRQQTAALASARRPTSSNDDMSFLAVFKRIGKERGLSGYWAGYGASLILTLNPSITFAVDNLLESRFAPKSHRESPSPALTFLISATSKAIASTITYPISLAKSRAQTASPIDDDDDVPSEKSSPWDSPAKVRRNRSSPSTAQSIRKRFLSLLSSQTAIVLSLCQIYKQEGIAGLYSGVDGEVIKGFLQHGLTMTVKESAHVGVIQAYYMLLRLTKKYDAELQKAKDAAVAVATEARERAEEAGHAIVEGGKQVLEEGQKVVEKVEEAGSAMIGSGKEIAQDPSKLAEKAEETGAAVVESGKQVLQKGQDVIDDPREAGTAVLERGTQVVQEARETIVKTGSKILQEGKKAVGRE